MPIDNNLVMDGVISLNQLSNDKAADGMVLLCSDNEKYYAELRSQLYKIISPKRVVDIFSYCNSKYYYTPVHYVDDRVATLELAAREIYINNVEGEIAECGVYQGNFSKYIARFFPDRTLYLFDTFDGFDHRDLVNDTLYEGMPEFKDTSENHVLDNIGTYVKTIVRKGWFPETTNGLENNKWAFVSLDTDLYNPILSGLEYFWPRLTPGGYIFVHDFGGLFGVNKAVMEYCKKWHIGYTRIPDYNTSAVLQKPL